MVLLWGLYGVSAAQESGSAAPAEPTDMERAAEVFRRGESLFQEGDYEAAILAFRESLALSGKQELHFNLAYCMELLGRLDEAAEELDRYRQVAPPEQQPLLERRLQAIRARSAAQAAPIPPPPSEPEPEPVPIRLHGSDWLFVGTGAAVGAFSLTGVGLTYGSAARHLADDDHQAHTVDRALNVTSWVGTAIGAGLIVTGIVRASGNTVSFDGQKVTLHGRF